MNNSIKKICNFYKILRKKNPKFYLFLKENKALKKFGHNCKWRFIDDSIGGAFLWEITKEGPIYWSNLVDKYAKFKIDLNNEL